MKQLVTAPTLSVLGVNSTDKMAFSNDSARQFRRQTIQSPSHAASISDSPVALSIRPRKISDSGQKIIPPQEKDAPRQQAVFLDQADEARTYLKDCLAGLQFPDEPREFILSVSSFYELEEDPDFESDREEYALLCDLYSTIY